MKSYYIIPIFVPHEGCPHDCVFCNQGKITGENKQDVNGPKNKIENSVNRDFVIKTVEEYLKTINTDSSVIEISFFGGTFTAIDIDKQRELLSVAKDYKEKGIIDYIRLSTRPDYIDDFILNHLKEYSVDIMMYPLPYSHVRCVENDLSKFGKLSMPMDTLLVEDKDRNPVVLFSNEWSIRTLLERNEGLEVRETSI